jgi:hypothetical protein
VIAFGAAITDADAYDRYAMPGIRRAAEPNSVVLAHQTTGSIFRNYNLLLDKAAEHDDLEALVLVHQDAEIMNDDFAATIRAALGDPDVAIVGCAGAIGVRSIAWWEGAVTWAAVSHRYEELGGGDFPALSWEPASAPSYAETGEVDSIDGFVMVLSPWAIRELRFDESLGALHGYDFDLCMQAKAAGKKVLAADFRAIHHHSLQLISDPEGWKAAYIRLAEKWENHLPDTGADPSQRALRAEADAACAMAIAVSNGHRFEAIKRQLARRQDELQRTRREAAEARAETQRARAKVEEVVTSRSWRLTEPLRRLRRRSRATAN